MQQGGDCADNVRAATETIQEDLIFWSFELLADISGNLSNLGVYRTCCTAFEPGKVCAAIVGSLVVSDSLEDTTT